MYSIGKQKHQKEGLLKTGHVLAPQQRHKSPWTAPGWKWEGGFQTLEALELPLSLGDGQAMCQNGLSRFRKGKTQSDWGERTWHSQAWILFAYLWSEMFSMKFTVFLGVFTVLMPTNIDEQCFHHFCTCQSFILILAWDKILLPQLVIFATRTVAMQY